jgi:hypothetical protein
MGIRNSAKSWAETISARAVQDAAFKNCCLRSGRYDGIARHHFFPRISGISISAGSLQTANIKTRSVMAVRKHFTNLSAAQLNKTCRELAAQ